MTKARVNADNASADIQGVTAGTGLTGGGTSGSVTLNVDTTTIQTRVAGVSDTEIGYLDGVTSAIQTQLNSKAIPANVVNNTLVDAKGDLITATAADTPARLAVGSDGSTLVADSSTTTGLRWQGNFCAGKNVLLNSDFRIWQRGTSASLSGTGGLVYSADRWFTWIAATSVSSTTSQQSFTAGTAPVAGYEGQFFIRQAVSSVSGQSIQALGQRIEDVRTFANQTVTLSFWAKADASRTYTTRIVQNFGSGGSAEVQASTTGSHSVTTSWQRFSVTIAVPSISGKTIGTSSYLMVLIDAPVNTANTLDVWGVQLEPGSVATAFETATGTLAGEFAAACRYYQRFTSANNLGTITPYAFAGNSTTAISYFTFPVSMRSVPTAIDSSNLTFENFAGSLFTMSSIVLWRESAGACGFYGTISGGTGGQVGRIASNGAGGYVGFSAEL